MVKQHNYNFIGKATNKIYRCIFSSNRNSWPWLAIFICKQYSDLQWYSHDANGPTVSRGWSRLEWLPSDQVKGRRICLHEERQSSVRFISDGSGPLINQVVVAEWLRRWTRNPLGSARAGSNPADYEIFFFFFFSFPPSSIGKLFYPVFLFPLTTGVYSHVSVDPCLHPNFSMTGYQKDQIFSPIIFGWKAKDMNKWHKLWQLQQKSTS